MKIRKEQYQLTYKSMKRASYMMCFIFWAPYSDNVDLTENEKEIIYALSDKMKKVFNKYPKLGWGVYDVKKMRKAYECLWNFFNSQKEELEPFIERMFYWNEVTEKNNYADAAIKDARAIGMNYLEEEEKLSSNN